MVMFAKTGVFTLNKVRGIIDIMLDEGINVSAEEREVEYYKEIRETHKLPTDCDFSQDAYSDYIDEYELDIINETCDCDQILIGFIKDPNTGLYEEDPKAEFSCICGELYGFVTASKYTCLAAKGSPCIPYQVDLESNGNERAFTLPEDIWGEDKPGFMQIEKMDCQNKTSLCLKFGACMDTDLDD